MFEGGGFGVGLAVADLGEAAAVLELAPPGVSVRPSRLGEAMPVHSRSDTQLAAELRRVVQAESALAAYKAELVQALAGWRPDALDLPSGAPGAAAEPWAAERPAPTGVSEFFADELAVVLGCARAQAAELAEHAQTLLERLPATWAALADGDLDWPRARALAAELGWPARHTDPAIVAEVEAVVLPTAAELSVRQLRAAARRELLRRDAAAADLRRRDAAQAADVTVTPAEDGMALLSALMPQPLAAACLTTLDTYARMAKADGDPRPIGRLRTALLGDLILRPWDTTRPPVTAHLAVTVAHDGLIGAGDAPASVDGQPITVAQVRQLLIELDALCPGGLQAPAGGTLTVEFRDRATGRLRATADRRELGRIARRGCPIHAAIPTMGATHDCGCSALGPPPRWTGIGRPMRSGGSSATGTSAAAGPAATTRWGAPTWTTPSPTPTARPTATTSAACADAITGSRPTRRAGRSAWSPTAPCT